MMRQQQQYKSNGPRGPGWYPVNVNVPGPPPGYPRTSQSSGGSGFLKLVFWIAVVGLVIAFAG